MKVQEKQFQQLLPNISNRVFIKFFLMPYNKFFGLGIKKEVVLRKRERERAREKETRERENLDTDFSPQLPGHWVRPF